MKTYIGECFKPIIIDGVTTEYSISTYGRVINTKTRIDKTLHRKGNRNQYRYVRIRIDDEYKNYHVHILVGKAFIPNPNNYPIINHKNGKPDILDNSIYGIEWTTYAKNAQHAYDTGLVVARHGEDHPFNKYSESIIRQACEDFEKGLTATDISNKYGMSTRLLLGIYHKRIWKHVVKDYVFKPKITHSPVYSTELRRSIINLLNEGHDRREVAKLLGLEYDNKIRKLITRLRDNNCKEEGSTTIESSVEENE